jgi:exodeoxyribonuclease VII large subunit
MRQKTMNKALPGKPKLKKSRKAAVRREQPDLFRFFSPLTDAGAPAIEDVAAGVEREEQNLYTVSGYLDAINVNLKRQKARIQGEISSLDIRRTYLFFTLKDKEDQSALNCFMWERDYRMCAVSFQEGLEVIVEGFPEIYKPSGRMSFKAATAEWVGEGALKKAYEELKRKLESEGIFAPERKKALPEFPERIGLITSESGAVIHDFLNNLGKYRYRITFMNSRVEGQTAVRDLVSAVRYFSKKSIDVLVIIRGGEPREPTGIQ